MPVTHKITGSNPVGTAVTRSMIELHLTGTRSTRIIELEIKIRTNAEGKRLGLQNLMKCVRSTQYVQVSCFFSSVG